MAGGSVADLVGYFTCFVSLFHEISNFVCERFLIMVICNVDAVIVNYCLFIIEPDNFLENNHYLENYLVQL
jgi:hypothetical protein